MAILKKMSRVQDKGQVTIPVEIRKKLGLRKGDLVAFIETEQGILISPQEVIASKALDEIGQILKVDYLVSLDKRHLVGVEAVTQGSGLQIVLQANF